MISVIIPCHNYGRYLPEAVASVVAQTLGDWEIIIVDDASTDDSLATAQQVIASYPERRMRLFTQPNSGPSATRNTGAQHACGEYLLFLDADDLLAPTFLERTVAIMHTHPNVGFVYSGMQLFEQDWVYIPTAAFNRSTLLVTNILLVQSLVRRAAWQQVGGFDSVHFPQGFEDWDFWLRVAVAGWSGFRISAPLVYYRRHGRGLSGKESSYEWDLRAQIIRKHPQLYGARLAMWATIRCARRNLPNQHAPHAAPHAREVAVKATFVAPQPFALPQQTIMRVSLARRLRRMVPYAIRFRVQYWRRRAQMGLRAAGFWT